MGIVGVTVINAEVATGGITANIINAGDSAEAVITTNTGNDDLTLDNDTVAFTVDAGDGDNVITVENVATATGVTTGSGNDTINLNDLEDADVIQVTTGAGADTVNVAVNGGEGAIVNTGDGEDQIRIFSGGDGFTANTGGDNDTISFSGGVTNDVVVNAGDGTDTVVLSAFGYTNIAFDSIEVVDINAGAATLDAASFASDNTFMLSGETGDTITIVAGGTGGVIDASGVTFDTGNEAILFDLTAGGDDIVTATDLDDILIGGGGNDTLNGGGGDDSITASVGAYVITGGDGNDTIATGDGGGSVTGGAGNDGITLGAGDDTVIFTAASDSTNDSQDVITGFSSGNDVLAITTGGGDNYLESNDTAAADFDAVVTLAELAFDAGVDVYVSVGFGGDTYVFVDANADGLFDDTAGDDYVIKLVGIDDEANIDSADIVLS